jgi:DNA helicase-2/ATP-dependent DNA helicase PcrA
MDPFVDLNPQQLEAVTAPLGPVLVLAGPGSGKTRVLTQRLAYLIHTLRIPAGSIAAVTFTNKAAREMGFRVGTLLGGSESPPARGGRPSLGTFHALCIRILRREAVHLPVRRDFVIFDDDDQQAVMRQVLREMDLDPRQFPPGRVHAAISAAKNELIEPADYVVNSYFGEVVRRAYEHYQRHLAGNNALDFDDLLLWAVRLLRGDAEIAARYRRIYPHLLVDEFQDTNTVQYVLLRLLAPPAENPDLFVVGDADQSIYRWRGADYRNVQRFVQDYPEAVTILLEQNYRSTQSILDAAMGVIDRQPGRVRKRLFTERGQGAAVTLHEAYDEDDEAQLVLETIAGLVRQGAQPRDAAIMYRTNAQSRVLEEAFLRAGLPYRLVGAQRFYGRREVKDVLAYLRLIQNPDDRISLARVLNVPARGLGAKTLEALQQAADQAGRSPGRLLLDLAAGSNAEGAAGHTHKTNEALAAVPVRIRAALADFGRRLAAWCEANTTHTLVELLDRVLDEVNYRGYVDDGTEAGGSRWENVLELRQVAQDFAELGLSGFLEQVALVSDQDTLTETANAPTLLTLHAAKGLEFPVVFLVGLDEGLLPHQRSLDDPEEMAEERRLFYVGITRAKDRLFLMRAFRRRAFGTSGVTDPSRFLGDIPADILEGELTGRSDRQEAIYRRQTRWETRPAEVEARFRVGMRVIHPSFGEGVVMQSRLDQDDEEVTVAFAGAGVKRLAASLAKLEVVE